MYFDAEGEPRFGRWAVTILFGLILLFGGGCWLVPKWGVYQKSMRGAAQLAEAQSNRQIVTLEALAKKESSKSLAEADSIRALGVAAANRIIGHSLKDNPEYLTWLKVEALRETHNQIIYVPTEAQLPITEASRLWKAPTQ